ncbi:MAG: hypothetical protein QM330_06520 [Acidobacteriota bacterium]|jgi:Tfp pilus assembly protein PilW|nr:hypothetical protein [Acidobacteriota bacterium]NLT34156.1 hypothetical protein [Acidobacteriota bacterium]
MNDQRCGCIRIAEEGFSLAELLVCLVIFFVLGAALFALLGELQQKAAFQAEMRSVVQDTRLALDTVERFVRQAGNDPLGTGIEGITLRAPASVAIRTDVKGEAGGDKGDPDGDSGDSDEDVFLRFNPTAGTLEIVSGSGPPQIVTSRISDLELRYYNESGGIAAGDERVHRIGITLRGATLFANPRTGRRHGVELEGEVRVRT